MGNICFAYKISNSDKMYTSDAHEKTYVNLIPFLNFNNKTYDLIRNFVLNFKIYSMI